MPTRIVGGSRLSRRRPTYRQNTQPGRRKLSGERDVAEGLWPTVSVSATA